MGHGEHAHYVRHPFTCFSIFARLLEVVVYLLHDVRKSVSEIKPLILECYCRCEHSEKLIKAF